MNKIYKFVSEGIAGGVGKKVISAASKRPQVLKRASVATAKKTIAPVAKNAAAAAPVAATVKPAAKKAIAKTKPTPMGKIASQMGKDIGEYIPNTTGAAAVKGAGVGASVGAVKGLVDPGTKDNGKQRSRIGAAISGAGSGAAIGAGAGVGASYLKRGFSAASASVDRAKGVKSRVKSAGKKT